jgi:hypothetical protein
VAEEKYTPGYYARLAADGRALKLSATPGDRLPLNILCCQATSVALVEKSEEVPFQTREQERMVLQSVSAHSQGSVEASGHAHVDVLSTEGHPGTGNGPGSMLPSKLESAESSRICAAMD